MRYQEDLKCNRKVTFIASKWNLDQQTYSDNAATTMRYQEDEKCNRRVTFMASKWNQDHQT